MKSKEHNPVKVEDGKLISIKYLSDMAHENPQKTGETSKLFA